MREAYRPAPEKEKVTGPEPMDASLASDLLTEIAHKLEADALPFKRTGDRSDLELAEQLEHDAEVIRRSGRQDSLGEADWTVLERALADKESSVRRELGGITAGRQKKRRQTLNRKLTDLNRLRNYLEQKNDRQAA